LAVSRATTPNFCYARGHGRRLHCVGPT
jgi:hypothetical protein